MATHVLGVRVRDDPDAFAFFDFSRKRTEGPAVYKAFAEWIITSLPKPPKEYKDYLIVVSSPLPDAWKLSLAIMLFPLIFTGLTISWWLFPGAVLFALSMLATSTFRYVIMRIGLRRWGYKGEIKRLNLGEVMRGLLWRRRK